MTHIVDGAFHGNMRRRCRWRAYEELFSRHLSFNVPKGQSIGGDAKHTVRKEGVKFRGEVKAEDKDLEIKATEVPRESLKLMAENLGCRQKNENQRTEKESMR